MTFGITLMMSLVILSFLVSWDTSVGLPPPLYYFAFQDTVLPCKSSLDLAQYYHSLNLYPRLGLLQWGVLTRILLIIGVDGASSRFLNSPCHISNIKSKNGWDTHLSAILRNQTSQHRFFACVSCEDEECGAIPSNAAISLCESPSRTASRKNFCHNPPGVCRLFCPVLPKLIHERYLRM